MIKKLKNILKLIIFIFIIKISFLVSFWGFLWEDMWFDLYKTVDKWIWKLEGQQYSYELRWQWWGSSINKELNKILATKGYWECTIEKDISPEEFEKVASWETFLLKEKLSSFCWDDISIINWIASTILEYKNISKNKSKVKSKKIFEISRMWIYTDWDINNSPFDLVKDIKDIDYIIFTEEIPYRWDKSINDEEANRWSDDIYNELGRARDNLLWNRYPNNRRIIPPFREYNTNIPPVNTINTPSIPYYVINQDNTNQVCATNESWLNSDETNALLINNLTYNTNNTSKSNVWTNILNNSNPNINKSEWLSWVQNLEKIKSDYFKITDDALWDCSKFFCIKVDFITYQYSLFWGSKTRSIQSIFERSNGHLKKMVSTSMVQWKMTTDNFELWLRDLSLSDMFSMPFIVTKKAPPILNLEQFQQDKKQVQENDKFSAKNNFCRRWESLGLNCKRENDLSLFAWTAKDQKVINNLVELNIIEWIKMKKHLEFKDNEQKIMWDFVSKAIWNDAQINETEYLYKEFVELERFVASMNTYTDDLRKQIQKMLEIPIKN